MITAPKRFGQNTTVATEVKKNGTEYIGIDQDGVAKTIAAETLLTKSNVGLGNVDNTADVDKPVSTPQQTALDLKAPKASPILVNATDTATVLKLENEGTGNSLEAPNFAVAKNGAITSPSLQIPIDGVANRYSISVVSGRAYLTYEEVV